MVRFLKSNTCSIQCPLFCCEKSMCFLNFELFASHRQLVMEENSNFDIKACLRVLQDSWTNGGISSELGHHLSKCAKYLLNPLHNKVN